QRRSRRTARVPPQPGAGGARAAAGRYARPRTVGARSTTCGRDGSLSGRARDTAIFGHRRSDGRRRCGRASRSRPSRGIERGARLAEVCPYEWALPENTEPLRAFVRDLAGQVDAVAFTSQIQVRNLFAIAAEMGLSEQVRTALNSDVIVAVVGPVCAEALKT